MWGNEGEEICPESMVCEDGNWKLLVAKNPPRPRAFHTATVIRYTIVIFGGYFSPGEILNSVITLNTETMEFCERKCSKNGPAARYLHTAAACGHSIVVHGGRDASQIFSDVFILDLDTWRWRQVKISERMPGRYGHACLECSSALLFIGGTPDDINASAPVLLDTVTWSAWPVGMSGNFPPSLVKFATAPIDNRRVAVYGGCEVGSDVARSCLFVLGLPERLRSARSQDAPEMTAEEFFRPANIYPRSESGLLVRPGEIFPGFRGDRRVSVSMVAPA
jgi:hypothetical protein